MLSPDVDERALEGETPEVHAQRLALEKARAVAERVTAPAWVLGADTLVVLQGEVLGKPSDARDACSMLLRLAGRTHRVLTGYALVPTAALCERSDHGARSAGGCERGVEESRVQMRPVDPDEAAAYAAGGEPLDKAGGYAVQGEGGRFVLAIEGSRSNVIGLPLEAIVPRLERHGIRPR